MTRVGGSGSGGGGGGRRRRLAAAAVGGGGGGGGGPEVAGADAERVLRFTLVGELKGRGVRYVT